MKTSLSNAFALVCPQWVLEFHLWPLNTSDPNRPYQSLPRLQKPIKYKPKVIFYYPMLMYSRRYACFEHPNLFKVNPVKPPLPVFDVLQKRKEEKGLHPEDWRLRGPNTPTHGPTTSFLTATTLIYTLGAGITAAAGTRLALQLFLANGFKLYSFR